MKTINKSNMATRLLAVGLLASFSARPALAQSTGGENNLISLIQGILDLLTGDLAKVIATLVLVVLGFLSWTGTIPRQYFFGFLVGCFLVFSSGWIMDQLITGA